MPLQTANQFQLTPDLQGSLSKGLQLGGQLKNQFQTQPRVEELTKMAAQGDKQALIELQSVAPEKANKFQRFQVNEQQLQAEKDTARVKSVVNGAFQIQQIKDPMAKVSALKKRRSELEADGVDTQDTDEALALYESGDIEGGNALIDNVVELGVRNGILKKDSAFDSSPTSSSRDFKQFQSLKAKALETGLDADIEAAKQFGRQSGFVRETAQEKSDIKVDEAGRKETATSNVGRIQGYIDSGVQAADSTSNLRRSIALLNTVKTGGIDSVKLKAKQLFGIEGADELELSTNLGKNVLAQLKPIFGAAFTAKEGEELKKIESGFGRSTAGNMRLLENALKLADRSSRRGIKAAEDQGDNFTADEIRASLNFSVEDDQQEAPQEEKTGGQIMVDSNGNRAMVYPDGTFKEL